MRTRTQSGCRVLGITGAGVADVSLGEPSTGDPTTQMMLDGLPGWGEDTRSDMVDLTVNWRWVADRKERCGGEGEGGAWRDARACWGWSHNIRVHGQAGLGGPTGQLYEHGEAMCSGRRDQAAVRDVI